jgi:hypothetical protein
MPKPSRRDHDECLRAAIRHKDKLSDAELIELNIVAAAWACNESVSYDELHRAHAIIRCLSRGSPLAGLILLLAGAAGAQSLPADLAAAAPQIGADARTSQLARECGVRSMEWALSVLFTSSDEEKRRWPTAWQAASQIWADGQQQALSALTRNRRPACASIGADELRRLDGIAAGQVRP